MHTAVHQGQVPKPTFGISPPASHTVGRHSRIYFVNLPHTVLISTDLFAESFALPK